MRPRPPSSRGSACAAASPTRTGRRRRQVPPLVSFVTQTRAGYCQHFAGAMALMLRYLGVPARVAVGFSSGRYDAKRGIWTRHRPRCARVGGGVVPRLRLAPVRPDAGGRSSRARPAERAVRDCGAPGLGVAGGRAIRGPTSDPRRSAHRHGEEGTPESARARWRRRPPDVARGSLLLLLAIVAGAALAGLVGTKFVVRRARYVTRDPRRLAAACRQELAAFLLDQNIEAARSATLHELGALVRHELQVDPDAFVAAASAARFGPPADARSRCTRRTPRAAGARSPYARAAKGRATVCAASCRSARSGSHHEPRRGDGSRRRLSPPPALGSLAEARFADRRTSGDRDAAARAGRSAGARSSSSSPAISPSRSRSSSATDRGSGSRSGSPASPVCWARRTRCAAR